MTAVDLLERDSLSTELVALLWQVYEHHGVVLFSAPTVVGKTTLTNGTSLLPRSQSPLLFLNY